MSVNVSPRQLRSGDLPEVVAECLRDTGLASSRLHLELTETAVISDEAHASALLSTLLLLEYGVEQLLVLGSAAFLLAAFVATFFTRQKELSFFGDLGDLTGKNQ